MTALEALNDFGFAKTRRAVAAFALSVFVSLYLLLSLRAPDGWGPAFLALSLCYLVAFLAVAADWFWGRWFAAGLGWSGVMVAAMSMVMIGWMWPLAIYGGLHALVVLLLLGKRMAALYDLQEGWRQRFSMDEFGVARLRKTVTRSAASLPSLILWALGPKEPGQGMLHSLFLAFTVVVGASGVAGVVRLRTWGVMALGTVAAALIAHGGFHVFPEVATGGGLPQGTSVILQRVWGVYPGVVALAAMFGTLLPGTLLLTAVAPFAPPVWRFWRRS